jgi:DNA-directed RNA polymerase subunit RPC12/RpoP
MEYRPNVTLTDPKTGEEFQPVDAEISIKCSICDENWRTGEDTIDQACPKCSSKGVPENREISHVSIGISVKHILGVTEPYERETLYEMAIEFVERQDHTQVSKEEIQIAVDENDSVVICTSSPEEKYVVRTEGFWFRESISSIQGDLTPLKEIEIASDTSPQWPKGNVQRIDPYIENIEKWVHLIQSLQDDGWEFSGTEAFPDYSFVQTFYFERDTLPKQDLSFTELLEKYVELNEKYYESNTPS